MLKQTVIGNSNRYMQFIKIIFFKLGNIFLNVLKENRKIVNKTMLQSSDD